MRRRRTRALLAALLLAASPACAGHAPPRPALADLPTTAAWLPRAVDSSKDVIVHADLGALRAGTGLAPAVEEGLLSAIDRSLEGGPNLRAALDGASEALVAFLPEGEPLILLRDVSADLDPTSLRAIDGGAQWEPAKGRWPGVAEYNYRPGVGSLFVLPDGTWVVGAGMAAQRVKNAFDEAGGAPILPARDVHPALELRVPAAALTRIARAKRIQRLEDVLLPALSLRVVLEGGSDAVATLDYPDAARAVEAEHLLRAAAEAFGRRGKGSAWLGGAVVTRIGALVRVEVAVPPTAFGDLAGADR